MMARCCLPHFDIERESPAAPSKSQHCWQPKSGAAHSPGKKICEKGAELSYPCAFCSHYIYSFTCFLFISVTKFMCECLELRRIFLFPSPLPLPQEKTFVSIWAFSYKGLFSSSWPSLAVPPFCSGWIIWCQVSTAAIPALVQHCNVQEMHSGEGRVQTEGGTIGY